ncbi:hypothetical protein [Thalassobaculum litoreum]|uniref:HTH DNA binding domain-containing protein n=1 Tax=Thalassobaculum litoreum DSM 18839 TaxID=1123362 RepID=A0A8G2F5T6_9PROT|nr:hypothetical protein [Thalassobaculum litoreum]SDG57961.1 hypothetical protein SAMN05660686_04917 [Thalassobaculum litoreum DSM 18839]
METSDIIASLDAFSAGLESERDPVQVRLDTLGDTRVVLDATDGVTRALLELERTARRIPAERRHPLLRIHEAVALTRLNGELVHADTLLLADLERTHSRIVGPTGTGLRALRALRALDDPNTPSLETAFLHLDRDITEWPADRGADPRVQAIRRLVEKLEAIVGAEGPVLARLYEVWRCVLDTPLPQSPIAGMAADTTHKLAGDDPAWLRQIDALNDTDPRRMFAAVALSWAAWRMGWTQDRGLCTAAALRAQPHPRAYPQTDRADKALAWMAQVCTQAAELTRLEVIRITHALEQLEHDAGGHRDRSRTTLIDCLCARPVITAAQLAADAGTTRPPALRFLNRLAGKGSCRWKGVRQTGRVAEASRLIG